MTKDYFKIVKPTYIENWPKELYKHSIPGESIELTLDQARRLGTNNGEFGETFGKREDISDIIRAVVKLIMNGEGNSFIRLGSRSPKDSYVGYKSGFKIEKHDLKKAMLLLLDSSERISDDLHLAIHNDYRPHIWIREWRDIIPGLEFRCFIKKNTMVGISQYFYKDEFAEISDSGEIRNEIIAKILIYYNCNLSNMFYNNPDYDYLVWDIYFDWLGDERKYLSFPITIEINPFFSLTDPCLFKWNTDNPFDMTTKGDFNSTFRYIRDGKTEREKFYGY